MQHLQKYTVIILLILLLSACCTVPLTQEQSFKCNLDKLIEMYGHKFPTVSTNISADDRIVNPYIQIDVTKSLLINVLRSRLVEQRFDLSEIENDNYLIISDLRDFDFISDRQIDIEITARAKLSKYMVSVSPKIKSAKFSVIPKTIIVSDEVYTYFYVWLTYLDIENVPPAVDKVITNLIQRALMPDHYSPITYRISDFIPDILGKSPSTSLLITENKLILQAKSRR
jgi:hypothetical protein